MGGKTKQRTKNNVRPSSSSRSAELLSTSVSLDGGLVTVGSGKVLPALFPTLTAVNLDYGLNPEIQICIKKLNKKNPITRTKALHELCELVNKCDIEEIVSALPAWAHCYKTLTADTDRKVREMTQVCHGAIVLVCGRRVAKQLRQLVPAWLQAQHDEHAPAQTHAHNSLKKTFPDNKLPEVISFCKAEVMAHFTDNLIGNTEAIFNKKIEDIEERTLQMCRIVTSTLRGLEYFIPALPIPHHHWLWEQLTPMLDSNAFWKFASNNAGQVRAAWYGAMARIIERYSEQFAIQYGLKLTRVVLHAAKENNALVSSHVWTTMLMFMHHVLDWYKYLEKKELLVKRIMDVLESGGWGDARHLSSMLLPFLAHLPDDILDKDFYETFFNSVLNGLDKKNIISSKSERQFWITSIGDCLRYLSIQKHDYVVEVVTIVHRTWLENVFSSHYDEVTRNNLIKCSATNMSSLVKYWLKQAKETKSEKYEQLLRNFWQNVGSTVLIQINRCGTDLDEIKQLIQGHILLLQTLKTSFSQGTKKQLSIKFDDDLQTNSERSPAVVQECDATVVQRYKHNLDELAHKICANYIEMAANKQIANAILNPIMTVLIEFDSKEMFEALAEQFHLDGLFYFYDKILKVWLSGDMMRCKDVVNIVFIMMKYLSSEEQDAVFDSFRQLPPAVVEWCLSVCLSHPHVSRPSSVRWSQSRCAASALVSLATRATRHDDPQAAQLLLMSLAQRAEHPLFSDQAICQVIDAVGQAIARLGDSLERSGALAARLVTQLADSPFVANNEEHFATLVLRLFTINIIINRKDSSLSVDTWCEVRSSWQDGLAALPPHAADNFLADAGELVAVHLIRNVKELNIGKMEHTLSLCPYLFGGSLGDKSDVLNEDTVKVIVQFTQQLFELDTKEVVPVETEALRYNAMMSQLNCLYDDDNEPANNLITKSNDNSRDVLSKMDILLYVNKLLFRAIYLRTVLLHQIVPDGYEYDNGDQKTWCEPLLSEKYIQQEFCNVLYDYAVVLSLNEGYCFWAHHDIIEKCEKKMTSLLLDIVDNTSETVSRDIVLRLSELAATKGYYWAHAHRWYVVHSEASGDDDYEGHALEEIVSGNGFFHVLQAKAKWCPEADLCYKVSYLVMLRSWNVAHSRLISPQFVSDMAACRQTNSLDVIVNAYYHHQQTMLYHMDISQAPWSQLLSNVTVVDFLSLMVQRYGWDASAHQWDFTTITLCSLLTSIRNSMHSWTTTRVAMLSRSVLRLYMVVAKFVATIRSESERRQPQPHVLHLVKEWNDIFAPDIHDNIYSLIVHVLSTCEGTLSSPEAVMLSSLIECAPQLAWSTLAPLRTQHDLALPTLAQAAAAAMRRASHPAAHYLAYHLLLNLAESLVFDDSQKLSSWSEENSTDGDEEKTPPEFLFDYFQETFTHLQEIVETALNSVVLGEEVCEIVPLTDSHSMTLSWLLLADALAAMCKLARGDLEQFYIQIYRERKYAPALLTSSLRLLPGDVFSYAEDATGTTPLPALYRDAFLRVEPFSMYQCSKAADIPLLACRCVMTSVSGAGCGGARGWWVASGARTSRQLERLVTAYVAPSALRDQLSVLHQRAGELDDTEIRIAWSSNEVVCLLSVDESQVELRVWLSRAHPLVPARLEADEALGGGTAWLALYLAYQNGTLLNALKMWTRAVNARVERAPQCYICYCRLHAATGRLPRVPCHQCRSRFHNQCLRKWFTTSNKSNCPLCRAAF